MAGRSRVNERDSLEQKGRKKGMQQKRGDRVRKKKSQIISKRKIKTRPMYLRNKACRCWT